MLEVIVSALAFLATHKKAVRYNRVASPAPGMPPMSWAVAAEVMTVVTVTSDGRETQNVASPGDVIMSGPSGERYVVKAAKFPKLYQEVSDGVVIPEQSPRQVAQYLGTEEVTFQAPWGEDMVLKPQDYLVREADGKGYYRIAKKEYELTYNTPGV